MVRDRDGSAVSFTDDQWQALLGIFQERVFDGFRSDVGQAPIGNV